MILIVDGGSTKAEWVLVDEGKEVKRWRTEGLNPYFRGEEEMRRLLVEEVRPLLDGVVVREGWWYGAGCTEEKKGEMQRILEEGVRTTRGWEVESDMLGAARAMCGREKGIVGILGTGSNSCFYDGERIVKQVSPLGYVLGDEGSGAVLGRLFLGSLLKNQLAEGLKEEWLASVKMEVGEVIERVYRGSFANRFLASVAPFVAAHIEEEGVGELVRENFRAFFRRNVCQYEYERWVTHCVGSVAHYFEVLVREAAEECGVKLGRVEQSPLGGLVKYHGEWVKSRNEVKE